MKIVWLSDLHFDAHDLVLGHDPRQRLAAAVDFITAHLADADLCLITGDVVETPTRENYAAVAAMLARLPMPVCPLPGNHDDRVLMREVFGVPEPALHGFMQYAVDLGGAVLLCLDSLVPGQDFGFLCAERLGWVSAQLARNRGRPVLVALHHPPVALGLPMLDPDNLRNGADLLEQLSGHDAAVQVLVGHVHRPASALASGIPIRTQRAVLYQAPAPVPAWDWENFNPPQEAPALGLVRIEDSLITVQDIEFCSYSCGGAV